MSTLAAHIRVPIADDPLRCSPLVANFMREGSCAALADALKVNNTLQVLSLKKCMFGIPGIKALMPGLRDNTSLTDLNLDYVRLHNEGAIEVAQVLEINTTLRVLSIRYNMINGEGVRSIVAALSDNLDNKIQAIDISGNDVDAESAAALKAALPVIETQIDIAIRHGMVIGNVGWGAVGAAVLATKGVEHDAHAHHAANGPYGYAKGC